MQTRVSEQKLVLGPRLYQGEPRPDSLGDDVPSGCDVRQQPVFVPFEPRATSCYVVPDRLLVKCPELVLVLDVGGDEKAISNLESLFP